MSTNIVGLLGTANVGKDTVARMIKETTTAYTLALAEPLKRMARELFNLTDEQLEGPGKTKPILHLPAQVCPACHEHAIQMTRHFKQEKFTWLCGHCNYTSDDDTVFNGYWTGRKVLQHLGTTGVRAIHGKAWINLFIRRAQSLLEYGTDPLNKDLWMPVAPLLIVATDVRFKDEFEGVKLAGGEIWRIYNANVSPTAANGFVAHQSEIEQAQIKDEDVTEIIRNDGSYEDLRLQVRAAVERRMDRALGRTT